MVVKVDAAKRARLKAARTAFRGLPRELKGAIRDGQRSEVGPIWTEEMDRRVSAAPLHMHAVVFGKGTRVKAGLPLTLVAGGSTRRLSGGGTPASLASAYDFGSGRRGSFTRYARKGKGGSHVVVRRTSRQLPPQREGGYVAWQAARSAIPRIIETWVHVIEQRIFDAVDGR